MSDLFDLINYDSFRSVWFWIFMALAWNSICHWTLSVPFDELIRAERRGGDHLRWVEETAHAASGRFVFAFQRGGPWIVAFAFFFTAMIVTFALVFRFELAQAAAAFGVPLLAQTASETIAAHRVRRENLRGKKLIRFLAWRRFYHQLIALLSFFLAGIGLLWNAAMELNAIWG
ncbi:MAG: hypothetical protein ACPGID_08205 [Rubricella sp.]